MLYAQFWQDNNWSHFTEKAGQNHPGLVFEGRFEEKYEKLPLGNIYEIMTLHLPCNHSLHVYMHYTWTYQVLGGSTINGCFSQKVFTAIHYLYEAGTYLLRTILCKSCIINELIPGLSSVCGLLGSNKILLQPTICLPNLQCIVKRYY